MSGRETGSNWCASPTIRMIPTRSASSGRAASSAICRAATTRRSRGKWIAARRSGERGAAHGESQSQRAAGRRGRSLPRGEIAAYICGGLTTRTGESRLETGGWVRYPARVASPWTLILGSKWNASSPPARAAWKQVLVAELAALGAREAKAVDGGVAFAGEFALCYAANLESRVASRVLWQVGHAAVPERARHPRSGARALPWPRLVRRAALDPRRHRRDQVSGEEPRFRHAARQGRGVRRFSRRARQPPGRRHRRRPTCASTSS